MIVVRFLYGRPLDTLLATFGVSLIMIQGVKSTFGYNIGVQNPTWLRGGFEVMQDLVLPYNRCFIIVLTACCVRGDLLLAEINAAGFAHPGHNAESRNGRAPWASTPGESTATRLRWGPESPASPATR